MQTLFNSLPHSQAHQNSSQTSHSCAVLFCLPFSQQTMPDQHRGVHNRESEIEIDRLSRIDGNTTDLTPQCSVLRRAHTRSRVTHVAHARRARYSDTLYYTVTMKKIKGSAPRTHFVFRKKWKKSKSLPDSNGYR